MLAAALLVVGTFGTAFAQEEDPASDVYISFEADRSNAEFGDEIILTLQVTYPDDHNAIVHKLPRDWGSFEIRDQSQAQTVFNDDGTKTTSQEIKVAVFGTGNLETPDLPISVRGPDGTVEQVSPLPVELRVLPGITDPDAPLEDIQSQADLSPHPFHGTARRASHGYALIALAALCALGYLLYRRFYGQGGTPCPSSTHERPGRSPSTSSTASSGSTCPRMGGSRSTTPSLQTPRASTFRRCTCAT